MISTDLSNYDGKIDRNKTTRVASFPNNAWGIYDMHGNLWEWCQDWYRKYRKGELIDPQGPANGKNRVRRGGSFIVGEINLRSADRCWDVPTVRYPYIGVRPAMNFR